MLEKLLEQKKCFKLICGAGNENLDEVEKLVAIYASAGCHFFDLSASEEVLDSAQKGLDKGLDRGLAFSKSNDKGNPKDYHFCISIGTDGDRHVQKAKICSQKCTKCGVCVAVCPQNAIDKNFQVVEEFCIGCFRCKAACKFSAIEGYSKNKNIETIEHLISYSPVPLSCIELHASDIDEDEVDVIWNHLNENFDGMLSVCLGRAKLSNERVLSRITRLVNSRKPYTTIIQADGAPMSGGEDDFKTTLQAVAMAELVQDAGLSAYTLLSGGTNSKTAELANLCDVGFNGVAVGSYARKIVKEYIERSDFWENESIFFAAQKKAKNLIEKLNF